VNRVLCQSPPAEGTAWTYQAGSGGGDCDAASTSANSAGVSVEFGVQYVWVPDGPYQLLYKYAKGDLTGSKGGSGTASSGYVFDPYVSITRSTSTDGNPFSFQESRGPYQLYGYGYIVGHVHVTGGGSGTTTSAHSFVRFNLFQLRGAWCPYLARCGLRDWRDARTRLDRLRIPHDEGRAR